MAKKSEQGRTVSEGPGEAARTKHASLGLACPCVGARCAVLFQVDRL
jgi:hypothetical protein